MEFIKKAATAIKRIIYAGEMTTMRESCDKMIATSVADSKGIETVFLWRHRTTKGFLDIRKAFVRITYLDDDKI